MLGGAIGDALGYPIEFMKVNEIRTKYGKQGITDLVIDKYFNKSLISDDTQMTLFTTDGLMWAYQRCSERGIGSYAGSGVYQSYLRWYYTQTGINIGNWIEKDFYENQYNLSTSILDFKELYSSRAPGNSCLTALGSERMGTIESPINNSKGCGGVMRVAPVGLFLHKEPEYAFRIGAEIAAITHGNPTGYLAAGAFAAIIAEIINGKSISDSTSTAVQILKVYKNNQETLVAIMKAIELSTCDIDTHAAIQKLGKGWIAEEALAIALYCSLKEADFSNALIMAVNHDGDSDSTGSICGNILGAKYGVGTIPKEWMDNVELKDFIIGISGRLFDLSNKAFYHT